jgi:AcrR family transcriptional regulator
MRPRDPQKAEKIRRKALEMLVFEGFDAFAMQKLAKAAEVSPATLYIYYKDREDLIFQLWQEQVTAWGDRVLEGFDPEAPFEHELWRQWTQRIRFFQERPLEWQFIQQVRHSALYGKYLERMPPAIGDVMGTFFMRCGERGEITDFGLGGAWREAFPREIILALLYAPLYAMLRWVPDRTKPLEESPAQVDREAIKKLFACVVKGLRP